MTGLDVSCPRCFAQKGQSCTVPINGGRVKVYAFHDERIEELNARLDQLDREES